MSLALEKVGSSFTGWIRSCFVCVVPGDGSQSNRQVGINGMSVTHVNLTTQDMFTYSLMMYMAGVEREMKVCHTQPHLVPPMKLVVYDDLPSPSIHQHRNSWSSWLNDSRHLATRASNRASMSLKRTSTIPLKIGAPSDFRRVQSFHDHPSQSFHCPPAPTYQPLDLRIHRSGNRLSDLPSFETFQLHEGPQRKTPAVPPRALTTSTGIRDRHYQKPSVLSRKPVGSQKRRSLGNLEPLPVEEPVRITGSSLLPHFSKVNPIETCVPGAQATSPIHGRSKSEGNQLTLNTTWPLDANISQPWEKDPQTPLVSQSMNTASPDTSPSKYSETYTESPSSASSHTIPSEASLLQFPTFPVSKDRGRHDSASSSHSNSVAQWMLPTSTKPSFSSANDFNWERNRTLSGTTVGSNTSIISGPRARNNNSISSAFSTAITPRTSFQVASPTPEKDLDTGACYPTIYEGQQQHHNFPAYHETNIGLAF